MMVVGRKGIGSDSGAVAIFGSLTQRDWIDFAVNRRAN
jgi:hypothetical protein